MISEATLFDFNSSEKRHLIDLAGSSKQDFGQFVAGNG